MSYYIHPWIASPVWRLNRRNPGIRVDVLPRVSGKSFDRRGEISFMFDKRR